MPARFPLRLPDLFAEDDRALLARFAARRDEAAFTSLVKRHAGMVLGVCRRAVGDAHMAEDAFQATFLVLARNPAAAAGASSVGGWLFGVARRVGLAARRHESRREKRERRAKGVSPPRPAPEWDDLVRVLDEELEALPEAHRSALVACFLQEQTQDEAARQLGWSLSTLRRRLDRGKELLRSRLARRGAALSVGLLVGAVAPSASAAPAHLVESAARVGSGDAPVAESVVGLSAAGLPGVAAGKVGFVVALVLVGSIAVGFAWPGPPAPAAVSPTPAPPPPVAQAPPPMREWVTVTGRVVFPEKRELPPRREITPADRFIKDADHLFADGKRLFFEDVVIDPKTRGIKNAVVWLRPDSDDRRAAFPPGKVHPALGAAKPREHVIDTGHFQFTPRVTAARAGDTLLFKNAAPVANNVLYQVSAGGPGAAFREFNVLVPAKTGTYQPTKPVVAGTLPDRFTSSIYPWMEGWVWAFDHPYSVVTDESGAFTIKDAPPGAWRLVVWHEKAGYRGGRDGRLGMKVTLDGGRGVAGLKAIELESDGWDKR
jgi:RNA polymerase sigma factor (sigma-70 family)